MNVQNNNKSADLVEQSGPSGISVWLKDHPAIVGSLLVFFISFVGTIYSWYLYYQFNLNIFDFAEPNDFILAAFKELITLGLSIFSVLYAGGALIWIRIRKNRSPKLLTIVFCLALMPLMVVPSALYGAYMSAEKIFSNDTPSFKVTFRDKSTEDNVQIIGSVDRFIFSYRYTDKKVSAYLTANITKIEKN